MSNSSRTLFAFLFGAASGVILGLLYAPEKGSHTRGKLSYLLDKYRNQLEDLVQDLMNAREMPASQAKTEGQKVIKEAKAKAEQLLDDVNDLIGQIKSKGDEDD
jgi:gas vesicle protein